MLIVRMILLSCMAFVLAACSQTPLAPVALPSPKVQSPTPSGLLMLQRRPLHLPVVTSGESCPTTPEKMVFPSFGIAQGGGPAYATIGTSVITSPSIFFYVDAQHFGHFVNDVAGQRWGGQKVLWFVNPSYQGLVLIRGKQLNGPHEIRFNPSLDQQLVLNTTLGGTPWPNFPSYTRLQVPGCYAYQVDGNNFSYVIVFQAVVKN